MKKAREALVIAQAQHDEGSAAELAKIESMILKHVANTEAERLKLTIQDDAPATKARVL